MAEKSKTQPESRSHSVHSVGKSRTQPDPCSSSLSRDSVFKKPVAPTNKRKQTNDSWTIIEVEKQKIVQLEMKLENLVSF